MSQPVDWLPLKIRPLAKSANATIIYLIYNKIAKKGCCKKIHLQRRHFICHKSRLARVRRNSGSSYTKSISECDDIHPAWLSFANLKSTIRNLYRGGQSLVFHLMQHDV
jgi:hypothetical protein